jgi:hypothetical protein
MSTFVSSEFRPTLLVSAALIRASTAELLLKMLESRKVTAELLLVRTTMPPRLSETFAAVKVTWLEPEIQRILFSVARSISWLFVKTARNEHSVSRQLLWFPQPF